MAKRLRIAINLAGRFHADSLARALIREGHDVWVFTTLPAGRFPSVPSNRVCSSLFPEILFRGFSKLGFENLGDRIKIPLFGRSGTRAIRARGPFDIILGWSSFSLEAFLAHPTAHKVCLRDSAHILKQQEILKAEYGRLGLPLADRDFFVQRELKEYALADEIFVLSDFARKSFIERGIPASKLKIIPLGVDTSLFFPGDGPAKTPLKIVYFGNLSVQKGIPRLLEVVGRLPRDKFQLHLVGAVENAIRPLLQKYQSYFTLHAPMPQAKLAPFIRTMDLYVLPTIHDGFTMSLLQAMASGLVPVVTDHCGAAELLKYPDEGYLIPALNSGALEATLRKILEDPSVLLDKRAKAIEKARAYNWSHYESMLAEWVRFHTERLPPTRQAVAR